MGKVRAVFIDRDGVVNELVYHQEAGIIDSPFTTEQFRLLPDVGKAIRMFHDGGYKVILVSNQPGIAKRCLSRETFDAIREKMRQELARGGASLDGEYYCFHHPEAKVDELQVNCSCRKPEPGLLLQAAQDMGIELSQSWMIGDNLTDVKAGAAAGCRTILLGRIKCELCNLMDEEEARPDGILSDLGKAAQIILGKGDETWTSLLTRQTLLK